MEVRKRYPSDVTDEQWALFGPFLDAWRAKQISVAGRLGEQDLREVFNAGGPTAGVGPSLTGAVDAVVQFAVDAGRLAGRVNLTGGSWLPRIVPRLRDADPVSGPSLLRGPTVECVG
jgi:hypothetical protein